MKKIFISILVAIMIVPYISIAADVDLATVIHPITGARKQVVVGDPDAFKGGFILETYEMNPLNFAGMLGAKPFRPSGYETTLSSSLAEGGAETELIVNSLDLPDGTTVTDDNYGDLLILTVGEGDSEEKIAVSGLNETTLTFTITSRGLEYGKWASSSDNIVQHLPGERVYVSNDDSFLYQQYYSLDGDETATGDTTFSGDVTFTGEVVIPTPTSSDTNNAASVEYVNDVATSGAANASATVKGIVEIGGTTDWFSPLGDTGALLVPSTGVFHYTPTSGQIGVVAEADGKINQGWIDLSEDFAFTGDNSYSGTTTFTNDVIGVTSFGGDGSDGALSITSGTTTINLASAKLVVKNYSSISITGTGVLAFSNPNAAGTIVVIKSSGDTTITSTALPGAINLIGLGGTGGNGNTTGGGNSEGFGGGGGASASTNGNNSESVTGGASNHAGTAGTGYGAWITGVSQTGGGGGQAQAVGVGATSPLFSSSYAKYAKIYLMPGSGGGGGSDGWSGSAGTSGGNGGRGGGALYMEIAGNYNCSSTLTAAGSPGITGGSGAGAGGSGGGGSMIIMYNYLTADTGTYTVSGGAATAGTGVGGNGGAGGDGYSYIGYNTEF